MSLTSTVLYIARVNTHTHTSYCAEAKKATEAQYPIDKLDHLSDLQNDALESKFRNITLYIAAEQIYYLAYKFFELSCDFLFFKIVKYSYTRILKKKKKKQRGV